MSGSKKAVAAPILIIAVGVGWLLTVQGIVPGVNWVWVLGLGAAGRRLAVLLGLGALDELVDFGRPRAIRLVALVDRGLRALPISFGRVRSGAPSGALTP